MPLLEESEHEDGVQCPDSTRLVMVEESVKDHASCKYHHSSIDLAS